VTLSKTLNSYNKEEKEKELYTGSWVNLDSVYDYMFSVVEAPINNDPNLNKNTEYQYYGYYTVEGNTNERDDISVKDGYLEMDRESLWKREISLLLDKVFFSI
jgi:hypothetical protein